ncbi:DNA repair exonuclease [Levilactobacillus koreensis JCM 16448]|uniref:DNA repair exonuclease n=1 Tax=Levilactobacillus koreensis TaxID=637971 RepID=A0AAC8UX41_9LACO|nr:DNA repair exonuclease [Levilactobacillus koreensis]AKP65483.1 DNA repair exonuclease [Levilactobacillus koreensis]KRK90184.1 DNA repair exonuclease [Levilactobacillus koreensis JCM 16448]
MKFIHAADLHLDSPFLGLTSLPSTLLATVRQSTFTAATRIFDRALAEHVDFVVLAGDLFDRSEQSVAAQAFLFQQFQRLADAQIPVFISFGNHDYAADQHQTVAYPANVTTFGPEVGTMTITLQSGETVAVSGFSYPERWVTTDPVVNFPGHARTDWHIGLLHGAVATGSADHYAPFTVAELLAKRYDYWALGHIHHRQLLNDQPPILYAGNPQGRSINETGAKGAYLVTSQQGKLVPEFFETGVVDWEVPTVQLTATTLSELGEQVTTWLTDHPAAKPTLTAMTATLPTAMDETMSPDWLSLYQKTHQRQMKASQRFIIRLNVTTPTTPLVAPQLDQVYWNQGAKTVFTAANEEQLFGKLAQNPALAEWFDRSATRAQLQALAEQNLRQIMGEAGHDVS